MANVKNLLPSRRRVGVLLGFFFLMAVLFSLFQFYYIPSNRDKLHQYGFSLLNRVKMNIAERDIDLRKFYCNKIENQFDSSISSIKAGLVSQKFADRFVPKVPMLSCLRTDMLDGDDQNACDGFGFIKAQDEWLRIYTFHNKKNDSFGLGLPVRNFLEPAFSYRKELFESYLVINNCESNGIVLYHDEKIGVGENVLKDSVLRATLSHSISQIVDIEIKGVSYKMFTYPFQLGNQSLVLCGTVKESRYSDSLRSIPAGLIYPILILILVALVALPFVKPYLLSPHEKLNISDIYLMCVALFAGLTLITLLVIQALILGANSKREEDYLKNLSKQVENSFLKEIKESSAQLKYFDSELSNWINNDSICLINRSNIKLLAKQKDKLFHNGDSFHLPWSDPKCHANPYYFLERVFWVDGNGDQIVKAQLDTGSYQFINVSERNYFRALKEHKAYLFPGEDRQPFVFDPIYSWTAGGFKVNLSRESKLSKVDTSVYAVLGSRFASLVNTVFPTGYGYCLIDEDGNVLTHSDAERNLRENFLQETGQQRVLIETINSRQSGYLNRVMMYGKPYAVYVSPVRDLPLHLVVFHDKTYRIPINLRILAFALVFIALFYIIAFVTLIIFRNVFGFNLPYSVFRPAIAYRDWVLPSSQRNRFYVSAIGFFIYYIFLFLLFCIFLERYRTDNFVTLVITLLTPVNLIVSLFLLERLLRNDHSVKNNRTFFTGWGLFFVIIVGTIICIPFDNNNQRWQYFLFEISWLALPIVLWFLQEKKIFNVLPSKYEKIPRLAFLSGFSWFTMVLISCFTILPASVFTWFAHNYEITQSVKKQQLAAVNSIVQRREDLKQFFKNHSVNDLPDSFFNDVQYGAGVYKTMNDRFIEVKDDLTDADSVSRYLKKNITDTLYQKISLRKKDSHLSCFDKSERFYLNLADNLMRNYYDPSNLPALSGTSSDSSWFWFGTDRHMFFCIRYPYASAWPSGKPMTRALIVQSEIPQRFMLLSKWQYRLAIILFTCGLIWLLVRMIKLTAARILLPDHTLSPLRSCKVSRKDSSQSWTSDAKAHEGKYGSSNLFIQSEEIEHKINNITWDPLATQYFRLKYDSALSDEELLELVEQNEPVFDRLWGNLSDKQKLLMLDMAQDGLINYRNTDEIRDLCGKGVLIISEDRMQLFSYAFGYFLRTRKMSLKKELGDKFDQTGTWASFRTPLVVIILSFAVFIFATQQDIWNKMIGLIGSLTAILTLLQRFIFTKGGAKE